MQGEEAEDPPAPLRFQTGCAFRPLRLHRVRGPNVRVGRGGRVASRAPEEYSGRYVFTAEPVRPGERLVVAVTSTENSQLYRCGHTNAAFAVLVSKSWITAVAWRSV